VLEGVTGRKTELAADGVEGIATRVKDFVLAIPRDVVQMSGETLLGTREAGDLDHDLGLVSAPT
jgi:hypothetical protein